jgi:urease accessory protein
LDATLHSLCEGDGGARAYPIVLGAAARGVSLSPVRVAALYLQGFAGILTSAAVRFVPLVPGDLL